MADVIDSADFPAYLDGVSREFARIDYGPCLRDEVGPALRERVDLNFALEQTAGGDPWAPLAASTVARKGHDKILSDTQRMKQAATRRAGDSIEVVQPNELIIGVQAGAFPAEYPLKHETGTSKMPARPFMNVNGETVDRAAVKVADFTVRKLKR